MPSKKIEFVNHNGYKLSAKLELPMLPQPLAFVIFAHVFTGNKNLKASRVISKALTVKGFAVLRFDFTGLGESEGDFSETNFTSNVLDLIAAADFLETNYQAPSLIVGHSLGGAASIFAGAQIPSIKAIATIGAPAEPEHVTHLLQDKLADIVKKGSAEVFIDGRKFIIKKQFLDDLQSKEINNILQQLNKALLVLHSPQDRIVGINNAAEIYNQAMHPKSFVTLNGADHMLTNKDDAFYAGSVIASWAMRYIPKYETESLPSSNHVVARTTPESITTEIMAGKHGMIADESEDLGGADFGPSPYELLGASLASSTAMTIQKKLVMSLDTIEDIQVHIHYDNRYQMDLLNAADQGLTTINRIIEIKGNHDDSLHDKINEAANCCPIFQSIYNGIQITTTIQWIEPTIS